MAVSNLNKDVATRLFQMIAIDDNQVQNLKHDACAYSKLQLIASQIQMLQRQAMDIVQESNVHHELNNVKMHVKKVPGNKYHLYLQNSQKVFSMIGPTEWNNYESYLGTFLYDYDCTFKPV